MAKRSQTSRKRKAGNGKGTKGRSTKDEKGRSCGMEGVVSGQSSVGSRVFSGDPQGSAFRLRIADFGLRNGDQEKESWFDKLTAGAKAYWPNEPIYGKGVVKPSVQGKVERSSRTSPSPSASVDLPHLSRLGGCTMMYLLPHIP